MINVYSLCTVQVFCPWSHAWHLHVPRNVDLSGAVAQMPALGHSPGTRLDNLAALAECFSI